MQCYKCRGSLYQLGGTDTRTTNGALCVLYGCSGCGERFEVHLKVVSIYAYRPEDEENVVLLSQCPGCHQWRDQTEETHLCEGT